MSAFDLRPRRFTSSRSAVREAEAGLFLGFLTYSSALSAPITGAIGDRIGKRRILITASLAITVFSLLYAVAPSYQLILGLVPGSRCVLVRPALVIERVCHRHRARNREGQRALATPASPASSPLAIAPWVGLWVLDHGRLAYSSASSLPRSTS